MTLPGPSARTGARWAGWSTGATQDSKPALPPTVRNVQEDFVCGVLRQ
ncbi:hypothetical protein [Streptomyces sp. NPDC005407]